MILQGTITAMITPFIGKKVDIEGLIRNIHDQINARIQGIVVLGSTGEAATLTLEEHEIVIKIAVQECKGRIPVIVGTGHNATAQTIEKTEKAKRLGADGALIVTPYYNKPTQEGIFRHFEAISKQVSIPIILYNIPGRAGVNMEPVTLARLAQLEHVIGVKESTGNIDQTSDIIHNTTKVNPLFQILAGDDAMAVPMIALGAKGLISVTSNLLPEKVVELVDAALSSDFEKARECHFALYPLIKALFIETNPAPIKEAMNKIGKPAGPCRLPLVGLSEENKRKLHACLDNMLAAACTN